MEKNSPDLSLLRPFNLELAKSGEPICRFDTTPLLFVGAGTKQIVVEHTKTNVIASYSEYNLRMAPLTWIEGKPVYKGDVLWYKYGGFSMKVTGYNSRTEPNDVESGGLEGIISNRIRRYTVGETVWTNYSAWSWEPPAPMPEIKEYWCRVTAYKQWDSGIPGWRTD